MKKIKRTRTVPVQDLGLNKIPTPDETYAYFQRTGRDNTDPDAILLEMRDIKHGPVKVYTKEEVAEYNRQRQRDWIEELDNE
jgi:hypothetical protein